MSKSRLDEIEREIRNEVLNEHFSLGRHHPDAGTRSGGRNRIEGTKSVRELLEEYSLEKAKVQDKARREKFEEDWYKTRTGG